MIDSLHISPTRWLGLCAFGLAAIACWRASLRQPAPWRTLAAVHTLFFVEMALNLRHRLHDAADGFLQAENWYAQREAVQIGLLALLIAAALAVALLIARRARRRPLPQTLALAATTLVSALFVLEIVSLHAIDSVMYARVGGVLSIGFVWACLGLAVALCAWRKPRA